MKEILKNTISRPIFQPIWQKLFSLSKIGINVGGGYLLTKSGEIKAFNQAIKSLKNFEPLVIFDERNDNDAETYSPILVNQFPRNL